MIANADHDEADPVIGNWSYAGLQGGGMLHNIALPVGTNDGWFLMSVYFDLNNDGLWDNGEDLRQCWIQVVSMTSLTVADDTNTTDSVTATDGTAAALSVDDDGNFNAHLDLTAAFDRDLPGDAENLARWRVSQSGTTLAQGTFADGATASDVVVRPKDFSLPLDVVAWIDADGDRRPGENEVTRTVEVTAAPLIEMQTLDTDTYELRPGEELTTGDAAEFVITRSGFMNGDLTIPLTFGGEVGTDLMPDGSPAKFKLIVVSETNTSNNTWECDQLLTHNSILMQSGISSVTIKLQALHDGMIADPEDDPRNLTVSIATNSAYGLGLDSCGTFYIHDTSTWGAGDPDDKGPAVNIKKYPFPDFDHYHAFPPSEGSGYTVVIVMGGRSENGASERTIWAQEALAAFPGPDVYIYNDIMCSTDLANLLGQFPPGSVTRLVVGGHGWDYGVSPANQNTAWPEGSTDIGYESIKALDAGKLAEINRALAGNAWYEKRSCGGVGTRGRREEPREFAACGGCVRDWRRPRLE